MNDWASRDKWLVRAARLEGMIDAHRLLKGGDGDEFDRLLWTMTDTILKETEHG